jgi:hypothetical protein
MVKIN